MPKGHERAVCKYLKVWEAVPRENSSWGAHRGDEGTVVRFPGRWTFDSL